MANLPFESESNPPSESETDISVVPILSSPLPPQKIKRCSVNAESLAPYFDTNRNNIETFRILQHALLRYIYIYVSSWSL
jgi:hypothetical protein